MVSRIVSGEVLTKGDAIRGSLGGGEHTGRRNSKVTPTLIN